MELKHEKNVQSQVVTIGVWDLKASLGCNLGPKDVPRHKLGTLAPIFTSRTLFSPESLHIRQSHTICNYGFL